MYKKIKNLDSIKVHIYSILHIIAKEVLSSTGKPSFCLSEA